MSFQSVAFSFALLLILSSNSVSIGQSIVDNALAVHESLRQFDNCLREQGKIQLEGQNAALNSDGKQTALWWQEGDRLSPLSLYGKPILEHATSHRGSRESLACLSYILEYGEGVDFSELHRSACDELIEHYRDDPELSVICSYLTNPLSYGDNEHSLTLLRQSSTSPLVQAASTFYLAQLLDNCIMYKRDPARTLSNLKDCGFFTAKPEMIVAFNNIEALTTSELKRRRTELMNSLLKTEENLVPWEVKRTFGRLNYKFSPALDGPTFRDMASDLEYEISNLRIDARDLLSNALADAKRQNKNVIVVFGGPSCIPCKVLKEFLATNAEFFDKDYTILHIDIALNENGQRILDKYTNDKSVPFTVILNPAGDVLSTSVGDEGNIGFPSTVKDGKHFISMLEKSAIRSNSSDFEKLARELNDFSEPTRRTAK